MQQKAHIFPKLAQLGKAAELLAFVAKKPPSKQIVQLLKTHKKRVNWSSSNKSGKDYEADKHHSHIKERMMFHEGRAMSRRGHDGSNHHGWQQKHNCCPRRRHSPAEIYLHSEIKRQSGTDKMPSTERRQLKLKSASGKMLIKTFTATSMAFFVLFLVAHSFELALAFAVDKDEAQSTTTETTTKTQATTFIPSRRQDDLAADAAELLDVLLEDRDKPQQQNEWPYNSNNNNRRKVVPSLSSSLSSSSSSSSSSEENDDHYHNADLKPSALPRTARRIIVPQQQLHYGNRMPQQRHQRRFRIDPAHPIHILFPLPAREGRKTQNPFGITILKARPVVDEGILEVYRRQLLPRNSLITHFNDSRTSDAHGPNVAINMLVENKVDCIIGYAFVYALAPVARMSPYWHDNDSSGIPVITSIGQTTNLDNREEYKLMTRISSPYKVVRDSLFNLFIKMQWRKLAYMFHDERYNSPGSNFPHGECYLLMLSLQSKMVKLSQDLEHNHFMFNELNHDHNKMRENLQKASLMTNGGCLA
ncbi:hypothetical protein niasHT_029174 [Heterodera trifolii]|uniref:Receptor ligand binding region domain-containing protein n=1 Tax=Heterodera trifolii TaxID=157864 RepID=A0ABD2JFR3_9BILA